MGGGEGVPLGASGEKVGGEVDERVGQVQPRGSRQVPGCCVTSERVYTYYVVSLLQRHSLHYSKLLYHMHNNAKPATVVTCILIHTIYFRNV